MDADDGQRPYGIRQFVVGTGGARHTPFESREHHSHVRIEGRHGVLAIELRQESYRWEFIAVNGRCWITGRSAARER
jgi:hypothetical protein